MIELEHDFVGIRNPPLKRLEGFDDWETVLEELPDLIIAQKLHSKVFELSEFNVESLKTKRELQRAYVILTLISQAYVSSSVEPIECIPAILSRPWCQVSELVGLKPTITYAAVVLFNWAKLSPQEDLTVNNYKCLSTFTGSFDEKWFYLISGCIDAKGYLVTAIASDLVEAISCGDSAHVEALLNRLADIISELSEILLKMYHYCDPHYFYNRIRIFQQGSLNNEKYPGGIVYGHDNTKRSYAGASAAQSPTIQLLDIILQIKHRDIEQYFLPNGDPAMKQIPCSFIQEMREYMPREIRDYLISMESRLCTREFCAQQPFLAAPYNKCIASLKDFRDKHLQLVSTYIIGQSSKVSGEAKGTGGTNLITFLKRTRDETTGCLFK